MTDPTSGFIAPKSNGALVLSPMMASDDDAVLAKAAEKLAPATVRRASRGFTGFVTIEYQNGMVVDYRVKAKEAKGG